MNLKKDYPLGIAFALVNTVFLGFVGLVDKIGSLKTNSPLIFSSQSLFFSLLFTLVFVLCYFRGSLVNKVKAITWPSWRLIILIGLLSSGLSVLFRFLGLIQSTGTFATLSQVITTLFTAIFAHFFLKEKLSKQFWALFVVIIVATYFVSIGKLSLASVKTGDLLILIGAVILASGNVFSRLAVHQVSPILLAQGRFIVGVVFLTTIAMVFLGQKVDFFHPNIYSVLSGCSWSIMVISFNFAIKK